MRPLYELKGGRCFLTCCSILESSSVIASANEMAPRRPESQRMACILPETRCSLLRHALRSVERGKMLSARDEQQRHRVEHERRVPLLAQVARVVDQGNAKDERERRLGERGERRESGRRRGLRRW